MLPKQQPSQNGLTDQEDIVRYTIWFGLTGAFLEVETRRKYLNDPNTVRVYNVDTHSTYYPTRSEFARMLRDGRHAPHTSICRYR